MANTTGFKARVEYEVTDGAQTVYNFPFSYLRKKFVMVSILHSDATEMALEYGTDYTVNDLSVSLTTPAKVGEHIIIQRQTDTNNIVTWNDGSILLARDMNTEDAQMLHLQEEQQDYIMAHAISTKVSDSKEVLWDALNHRIINVNDPKDAQDVVTKNYMESVQSGFVTANTKLLDATTTQASAAKASQEAAKSSQDAAKVSETNAETSNQTAKKWAESTDSPDNVVDTQSRTGKTQSSRSWSLQAEEAVRNINFYMMNILQRSKAYAVGDIAYSPKLPSWARLECVSAGKTADTEPSTATTVSRGGVLISDGTVTWIVDDVRDGNRAGDIVLKPTLNAGYIKANGATVKASEYPRLLKFAQDNNLCVTDSAWSSDSSTKYVYDESADTLKVPNAVGRVLQGADSLTTKEAGLPNITGGFESAGANAWNHAYGAFYMDGYPFNSAASSTYESHETAMHLDASKCNSIYGSSDTVQPPACCLIAQIKY